MGKVKKNLGIGMLITAACFLFNPNVVIIDILPDFIGYIFLILGIYQLSDINYYFEESLKLFKRMLVVSLIQFFSIFFGYGYSPDKRDFIGADASRFYIWRVRAFASHSRV